MACFVVASLSGIALLMCSILFFQVNEYHLPLRFVIVWWPIDSNLNWALNYSFQLLLAIFSSIFLLAYFPLTLTLMNQSCWGLDALSLLLREMRFEEAKNFDEGIKKVILRSYRAMEWQSEVQDLLKFNFLVEFSVLSTVLCLCLFTVAANPMGIFIGYVIMQITLAQLFLYCWVGNKLAESVEALEATVYDTNWYEMPAKQRTKIHLMLCMAQRLKGFHGIFLDVNMETFQKVRRTS